MKTNISTSIFLLVITILYCVSCKEDDPSPAQTEEPSDFFTLKVDSSFPTAESDNWLLASSESGEWIAWEPFDGGETKILNGFVPKDGTFTIHFLSIPTTGSGQKFVTVSAYEGIVAGSSCLLKGPGPGIQYPELTLNVSNYTTPANRTFPNQALTISSSTGTGGLSGSGTENSVSYNIDILKSPADIQVTLYKGGYPYYVRYENVSIPSTINIDASAQGKMADRTFTMRCPKTVITMFTLKPSIRTIDPSL